MVLYSILSSSAFFPSVCQDLWLTGSSDFLTLPLSINALVPLVACVILDIRAALWRGGAAGRNEGRKGWMIGGLERDEWGHPAVISLLFLPLLEPSFLFFLFPTRVSPARLSLSVSQGNQFNFNLRKPHSLPMAPYQPVFYTSTRLGTWCTLISAHTHTHTPLGRRRAKSGVHITTRLLVQWEQAWSKTVKSLQIVPPLLISKRYHPPVSWMHCFARVCCAHARLIVHDC